MSEEKVGLNLGVTPLRLWTPTLFDSKTSTVRILVSAIHIALKKYATEEDDAKNPDDLDVDSTNTFT